MEVKNNLFINCEQASFLSSKREDVELNYWGRVRLKFHFVICSKCRTNARHIFWMSLFFDFFRSAESEFVSVEQLSFNRKKLIIHELRRVSEDGGDSKNKKSD